MVSLWLLLTGAIICGGGSAVAIKDPLSHVKFANEEAMNDYLESMGYTAPAFFDHPPNNEEAPIAKRDRDAPPRTHSMGPTWTLNLMFADGAGENHHGQKKKKCEKIRGGTAIPIDSISFDPGWYAKHWWLYTDADCNDELWTGDGGIQDFPSTPARSWRVE